MRAASRRSLLYDAARRRRVPMGGLFDEVFAAAPLPEAETATRSHPEIRVAE